jgi:hypothetical protein
MRPAHPAKFTKSGNLYFSATLYDFHRICQGLLEKYFFLFLQAPKAPEEKKTADRGLLSGSFALDLSVYMISMR